MKKGLCVLVLICVIMGAAFAQQKPAAPAAKEEIKNWVSGEIGLIEIGARYERMLSENLSVGGTIFWNSFFFLWNSLGIEAVARYYLWAGNFYVELGLGYGTVTGIEEGTDKYGNYYSWFYATEGVMVTPGVGWKIDVGNPGGFFINPMISIPIVFGMKTYDAINSSEFKVGMNFKAAFGMGYAF